MKLIFCYPFLLMLCFCNSQSENYSINSTSYKQDSVIRLQSVIKAFNSDEKKCSDSVEYYNLGLVSAQCIKILYSLYADKELNARDGAAFTTVGECNIRLVRFSKLISGNYVLGYDIFWNDSIPISWKTQNYRPDFISALEIERRKKEIKWAYFGQNVKTNGREIIILSDSSAKTSTMASYIRMKRQDLHEKFLKLIVSK